MSDCACPTRLHMSSTWSQLHSQPLSREYLDLPLSSGVHLARTAVLSVFNKIIFLDRLKMINGDSLKNASKRFSNAAIPSRTCKPNLTEPHYVPFANRTSAEDRLRLFYYHFPFCAEFVSCDNKTFASVNTCNNATFPYYRTNLH